MIKHEEAIKKINEFRNRHYNDIDEELRNVAQALNVVLPKTIKVLERAKKVEELLELYKEYFQIVERGDNDWHYRMNEIPEQIKALEEELKKYD